MQNKPNLLNAQMNLTSLITVDYENKPNCKLCENKPNTNPIKANTMPKQTQFQNQPRRPDKSGGLIIDVADSDAYNTAVHS